MLRKVETQDRPLNWALRMFSYARDGIIVERLRLRWKNIVLKRRREWWQAQRARQDSFVFCVQHGVRMRLFLGDELSRTIYVKDFEADERCFHNAFLKPGDVYLDIGANLGLFTLIAASRVGFKGRVFSIEPCPAAFQRLLDNIRLNGFENVSAYQIAISDTAGRVKMAVSLDGYDAWNTLAEPEAKGNFSNEIVTALTLDQFTGEHNLAGLITMIKIDVEGWETHVLAGGVSTLSAGDAPVLQVEFAEKAEEAAGASSTQLYQALVSLGYQMFAYDAKNRDLLPVPPEAVGSAYRNLVAAKRPAAVAARLKGKS